ncbi:MAG: hypothetical protein AB7G93_15115 [Bdellovibrionales bacterium]
MNKFLPIALTLLLIFLANATAKAEFFNFASDLAPEALTDTVTDTATRAP